MTRVAQDLGDVIEKEWCIGCGACTQVPGGPALIFDDVAKMYRPSIPANQLAAAVCPAIDVDYGALNEFVFGQRTDSPFGVVESVFLAQSTDIDRNMAASSGGMIKEVLLHLIESGEVDAAISLAHVEGLDFDHTLVRNRSDVDALPGSIYHNVDQTGALKLLREAEGPVVLVGIPCSFEGIFKFIEAVEPQLKSKIRFSIGLLCGWQYTHHSIEAMAQYLDFPVGGIANVAYRGGGPVGKFRVELSDGTSREASRRVNFSYQVGFDRHFNTRRCHICVNHSNYLADLVVGDAWLPATLRTRTGISLLIARTDDAREIVLQLEEGSRVRLAQASEREILSSQGHRVAYGEFAYAYAEWLRAMGEFVPNLTGPNEGFGARASVGEIRRFHREFLRKRDLQRAGRYRALLWRKATLGFPSLMMRYARWFWTRVLRLGRDAGEVTVHDRLQLDEFI